MFERARRIVQTSRLGASKADIDGYGFERRQVVYIPRRNLSSPALVCQSMPLPNAALTPRLGCKGFTGGPYIFGLSKPLIANA